MKKCFALLLAFVVSAQAELTYKDAIQFEKNYGTFKALGLYKSLVNENNPDAMLRLAQIYSSGKTIKRNITKAHELLERASKLNHNKATHYLGKLYLAKKTAYYDVKKAYNSFVKAANNGYAPSQNMVGQFLASGVAVDKDYKLSVLYFERASKQGHVDAHCNLAFMYASGKGVFPNFGRAHNFAKEGLKYDNKKCKKVWDDFNLEKYDNDKGWKFNFYTKPQ